MHETSQGDILSLALHIFLVYILLYRNSMDTNFALIVSWIQESAFNGIKWLFTWEKMVTEKQCYWQNYLSGQQHPLYSFHSVMLVHVKAACLLCCLLFSDKYYLLYCREFWSKPCMFCGFLNIFQDLQVLSSADNCYRQTGIILVEEQEETPAARNTGKQKFGGSKWITWK